MPKLRLFCCFVTCWFVNVSIVVSQSAPPVKFDHPLADFTLPSESITTLYQDNEGLIWAGTTVGLVRYDGQNVHVYQHIPGDTMSLSSRQINGIAEHSGALWIATDKGLNRFDPVAGTFERFLDTPTDPAQVCGEYATAIVPKDDSSFWFGSLHGLCEFNTRTLQAKLMFQYNPDETASLSYHHVLSIQPDHDNNLWVGTAAGLNFIDIKSQAVRRVPLSVNASEIAPPIYTVQLLNNVIWAGTWGQGIKLIDADTHTLLSTTQQRGLQSINSAGISQILIDRDEHIWIANYSGGLCRQEANGEKFHCMYHEPLSPYSLSDNKASALLQDSEGNLWVGTWGGGLDKIGKDHGFETITINQGSIFTPEPTVHAIYELDENRILIGTPDDQFLLGERTGNTNDFDFTILMEAPVRAIDVHDNTAWLASSREGLKRLNLDSMEITSWSNNGNSEYLIQEGLLYDLLIDNNKGLWVTTNGIGVLYIADVETQTITQFSSHQHADSLSSDEPWPLFQDNNGDIWIGTLGGGLNKFDATGPKFTSFTFDLENPASISSNDVSDITTDKAGHLWISTQMGINRLDQSTMQFQHWTEADGLSNNQAYCALIDETDKIWIATRDGLSVLEQDTGQITRFYAQNQLPSNHFTPSSCHKGASGRFYFGTEAGILTFLPENIDLDVPDDVRVKITAFTVNGAPKPLQPNLDLTFDQNSLVFEVAALSYAIPERNQIEYRLSGNPDTSWINLEGSTIRFANISPGDYHLEIKAKNSYGRYSQTTVSQPITINVPYWQTSWFRVLATLLACLIIYGIYQARMQYTLGLAKRSHEAQLRIEKLRNDLAADYHDGVGGSLGSLGIEMGLIAAHQNLPAELKGKMQTLIAKLKRVSELRREMSWIIDAKNDLFSRLLDRIRQIAFDIVPSEKLQLDIPKTFRDRPISMEARRQCLFFVKEALQNAVKHADASKICIRITQDDTHETFSIIDNGIGFDPETVVRGEGLDNLKHRAEALKGTLYIGPNQPTGSVVRLTVIMDDSSYPAA